MQNLKTHNLLKIILAMLCIVALAMGINFLLPKSQIKTANALTSPSATVGELYDDSSKKFSKTNLDDLAKKLLGNDKNTGDLLTATESGAKKASEFATQNIEIMFGGMSWTPVYLANSGDIVVLTVWLSDLSDSSKFSANGNNMYGSSYIRAVALNNGGEYYSDPSTTTTASQSAGNAFARFTLPKKDLSTSLTEYLLTPAQVEWQGAESAQAQGDGFDGYRADQPNDSYLRDKNITYGNLNAYQSNSLYDQWKDDYVWLPSLTELGGVMNNGLWKPTTEQRMASNVSWLRTASYCENTHAMTNTATGVTHYSASLGSELGIRPCIHLNLTEILGGRAEDVETIYNGSPQTLANVSDDQKYWYKSDMMDITPLTSSMKDAGTYVIKVELNKSAIDAGKEFLGDPDPNRGNGDESATLRYINFVIKPKELSAKLEEKDSVVTLTVDPSGLCGTDSLPNTAIQYTSTDGAGYNSTTAPQQKGDFKAEPKITDTNSNYKLSCTPASVTYTLGAIQVVLPTLPPTANLIYDGSLQTVTLSGYTHNGKGVNIFKVEGKTASNKTVATAPAFDTSKGEITVKDAGTYTVTLTLEDTTNCEWKIGGGNGIKTLELVVKPKQLTLAVGNDNGDVWNWGKGTAVNATVTLSDIVSGDNVNLTTKYTASNGAQVPSQGTANGGATSVSDTLNLPANLVQDTYTLTAEIDNENYSIADGLVAASMPLNFTIGASVFDPDTFTWTYSENGTGTNAIADGDSFLKYTLDAAGNPYEYKLSINLGSFVSVFQTLTDTDYTNHKQTDADTYTTTVRLTIKNSDYSFDLTKTYTNATVISTTEADVVIHWTIQKGDFTGLENLPWVYRDGTSGAWVDYNPAKPPEYSGKTITVKLKGDKDGTLHGLKPAYGAHDAEKDINNYALNVTFSVTDSKNFNVPAAITFNWEITKKIINVQWESDVAITYNGTNAAWAGNDYYATQLRYEKSEFADKVEYIYSCTLPDGSPYTGRGVEALAYITEQALAASVKITVEVEVELKSDPAIQKSYDIVDSTGGNFKTNFVVGDSKLGAKVELTTSGEYSDFNYNLTVTGEDMDSSKYTATVYKGTNISDPDDPANTKIENFDPKTAAAGEYFVVVALTGDWENEYRLSGKLKAFEILPKSLDLPTLGDIVFTGGEINLVDYMTGFNADLMEFVAGGSFEGLRNVSENGYTAQLKLKDSNYRWNYDGNDKVVASYRVSDYEINQFDSSTAVYKWNISPLVVDTTNMWSKGSKGATLNLPNSIKDLIAGGTLEVGYRYYDTEGNYIETPEIKGNKQFKVEAVFSGDDSVRNVQFKTGDASLGNTSPAINYTVPQSGASAFFGNALSFLKNHWWWFLIALAILLFFIILIILLAKRRKNKEEREEKKRKKEEEKERKEEEKRRREEEREEEKRRREEEREERKRKQEAELELQKAKQEAELAKMKAELGLGAGAAGMAMAAQAMPTPQQQAMPAPAQQVVDNMNNELLREMREQMAELRADNKATQAKLQALQLHQQMPVQQSMPTPMYQQPMMPYPQPAMPYPQYGMPNYPQPAGGGQDYHSMMAEERARAAESRLAEERVRAAEEKLYRAAEQRAMLAEERFVRGGMPVQQLPAGSAAQVMPVAMPQPQMKGEMNAEFLGTAIAAALKNSQQQSAPVQMITQSAEESKPVSVSYPADAVVTTTTTVDTTKSKPEPAPHSDDGRLFDVDGFYDTFENK